MLGLIKAIGKALSGDQIGNGLITDMPSSVSSGDVNSIEDLAEYATQQAELLGRWTKSAKTINAATAKVGKLKADFQADVMKHREVLGEAETDLFIASRKHKSANDRQERRKSAYSKACDGASVLRGVWK